MPFLQSNLMHYCGEMGSWGECDDYTWELLVLTQTGQTEICGSSALGPDYVSPIAAIGSFTSRGEDCSEK